jgi:HK97 family phage prohead protease
MPKVERRAIVPRIIPVEFRVIDEGKRTARARVCVYNVIDDFGTVWLPGCWTEGLERKLPRMAWGHDWLDIIGRAIGYEDSEEALDLVLKFSDFAAVPRSRQAWTQLRDEDVDEWSFGFDRVEWTSIAPDSQEWEKGIRERMVKAIMWEASPVLVGAVPGTKTLAVRAPVDADGTVDVKEASSIAVLMAAGEIDLQEALTRLKEGTSPPKEPSAPDTDGGAPPAEPAPGDPTEPEPEGQPDEEVQEAEAEADIAEIDAALAFAEPEREKAVLRRVASGATDLPLASRTRPWDAGAANKRVAKWASKDGSGSKDQMDWPKFRKGHFWYDAENSANFTAYKLPFTDVIGGELHAVPRGIFAVAQRLDSTDIPASDKDAVKGKMTTYYRRMAKEFDDPSIKPPWQKAS